MHKSAIGSLLLIVVVACCACPVKNAGIQSRTKEKDRMIPENVILSLRENGFDCVWNLEQPEINARADLRPQLVGLIDEAESFVAKIFKPEWLPQDKEDYLKPVRGQGGDPDRLIHRYKGGEKKIDVEVVCGEFSVTLNVATPQVKPVSSSEAALATYRSWSASIINSEKVAQSELVAKKVDSYWIISQIFDETGPAGEPQKRYTPWTWLESVRMAVDGQGKWLSVSVQRLPDRVDSMPKGGAGRSGGSWFDAYISSLTKP